MIKKNTQLVYTAILSSIIILLSFIPQLGFIQIGPISFTIIHAIVIIGILTLGLYESLFLGTLFGICSLIVSFIYASSPTDLLFHNPLISVLPRIGFAIYTYLIKVLLAKISRKTKSGLLNYYLFLGVISLLSFLFLNLINTLIKNASLKLSLLILVDLIYLNLLIMIFIFKNKLNLSVFIAAIGTIIHTGFVLLALSLFIPNDNFIKSFISFIKLVFVTNTLFEIMIAIILSYNYPKVLKRFKGVENDFII